MAEKKQMYKLRRPDGSQSTYHITPTKLQEYLNQGYIQAGGQQQPVQQPQQTAQPTQPAQSQLTPVNGMPGSSDEYDQWIEQGYVFQGGKWYKPSGTTQQPVQSQQSSVEPTTESTEPSQAGTYTIQSGDTLSQIAQNNNTTVQALMAANPNITDPNMIIAGANLNIPQTGQTPVNQQPIQPSPTTPSPQVSPEMEEQIGDITQGVEDITEQVGQYQPPDVVDEVGELVIPQELQDDPYFMQLDSDMQAMAIYSWNITQAQQTASEEETQAYQDAFLEAIDEATAQASPYWAEQLGIIKQAFQTAIGVISADLESMETQIATNVARLEEDLKYNKDQMTIEQQAELGRQLKNYNYQLKGVRENMASRGLSSSSIRLQAQERTKESHEDIVESSQRAYERAMRGLGLTTERGLEDLATQLSETQRKAEEAMTSATHTIEAQIGSDLLDIPETEQYEMGGIYGAPWQSAQQSDILTRAQNIMALSYPML